MRTELVPAADVRLGDCVLDDRGRPAVVTSMRWQGAGGGLLSIGLSTGPDRRSYRGRDLLTRAVLTGPGPAAAAGQGPHR